VTRRSKAAGAAPESKPATLEADVIALIRAASREAGWRAFRSQFPIAKGRTTVENDTMKGEPMQRTARPWRTKPEVTEQEIREAFTCKWGNIDTPENAVWTARALEGDGPALDELRYCLRLLRRRKVANLEAAAERRIAELEGELGWFREHSEGLEYKVMELEDRLETPDPEWLANALAEALLRYPPAYGERLLLRIDTVRDESRRLAAVAS